MSRKLVFVEIERKDVESGNVTPTLKMLNEFKASANTAKAYMGQLELVFCGYDHDSRNVWEIPEIRDFVSKLNNDFKHWLFFLRNDTLGLITVAFCLLKPTVIVNGWKVEEMDIERLLKDEWWAGFNEMSELTGLSRNAEREKDIGLTAAGYLFCHSFMARKKSIFEM